MNVRAVPITINPFIGITVTVTTSTTIIAATRETETLSIMTMMIGSTTRKTIERLVESQRLQRQHQQHRPKSR